MAKANPLPTRERLHELFNLDEQGNLHRRKGVKGYAVGSPVGRLSPNGYLMVMVDQKSYMAHRLILWMSGADVPLEFDVDHINGNRLDNRPLNLRAVPKSVNSQNQASGATGSTSRLLGVCAARGAFQAQIGFQGQNKYLGRFSTEEAAHEAYVAAKEQLHAGFVPERFNRKEVA